VAILIADKTDIRAKTITRSKEGHFIIIWALTHQVDVIILNVYSSSNRTSKYEAKIGTTAKRNGKIYQRFQYSLPTQ
jgi:hypothetical protein